MSAMTCPCCGAEMEPMRWERTDRMVLVCSDTTCGHWEPLPASYEVTLAGGARLPGLDLEDC